MMYGSDIEMPSLPIRTILEVLIPHSKKLLKNYQESLAAEFGNHF